MMNILRSIVFLLSINFIFTEDAVTVNNKIGLVLSGGGVGIGLKTPIGPIQFILSRSNKEDLMGYLNIGYNF